MSKRSPRPRTTRRGKRPVDVGVDATTGTTPGEGAPTPEAPRAHSMPDAVAAVGPSPEAASGAPEANAPTPHLRRSPFGNRSPFSPAPSRSPAEPGAPRSPAPERGESPATTAPAPDPAHEEALRRRPPEDEGPSIVIADDLLIEEDDADREGATPYQGRSEAPEREDTPREVSEPGAREGGPPASPAPEPDTWASIPGETPEAALPDAQPRARASSGASDEELDLPAEERTPSDLRPSVELPDPGEADEPDEARAPWPDAAPHKRTTSPTPGRAQPAAPAGDLPEDVPLAPGVKLKHTFAWSDSLAPRPAASGGALVEDRPLPSGGENAGGGRGGLTSPPARQSLEDDLEFEAAMLRSRRRRFNWMLIAACAGIGGVGLALGTLGGSKSPADTADAVSGETPDVLSGASDGGPASEQDGGPGDASADGDDMTGGDTGLRRTADGSIAPVRNTPPPTPPPPSDVAEVLERARRGLDARRWEEAGAAYDQALRLAPDNLRARFGRARALAGLGRKDQALADAAAVVAGDATHPQALLLAAELATELGQKDLARSYQDRYLAAWPATRKAAELRKQLGLPEK